MIRLNCNRKTIPFLHTRVSFTVVERAIYNSSVKNANIALPGHRWLMQKLHVVLQGTQMPRWESLFELSPNNIAFTFKWPLLQSVMLQGA